MSPLGKHILYTQCFLTLHCWLLLKMEPGSLRGIRLELSAASKHVFKFITLPKKFSVMSNTRLVLKCQGIMLKLLRSVKQIVPDSIIRHLFGL